MEPELVYRTPHPPRPPSSAIIWLRLAQQMLPNDHPSCPLDQSGTLDMEANGPTGRAPWADCFPVEQDPGLQNTPQESTQTAAQQHQRCARQSKVNGTRWDGGLSWAVMD